MKEILSILFLEDDPISISFISKLLQNDRLFQVTSVQNRTSFISSLQQGKYDCLVLDYMLPDISGVEALNLAAEMVPEIPSVIYTGSVGEEKVVECMKAGASDFILKSQPSQLIPAIMSAIKYKRLVDERTRAENAVRESERRYQTLTEMAPVGIFHTDRVGNTIYVNPRWCAISGLEADKALGNGWLSVVHPDDIPTVTSGWNTAVQNQSISSKKYRFCRPDGKISWVLGHAVPEYNSQNELMGYIGTITDISELTNSEEQARKLSRVIEQGPSLVMITDIHGKIEYVNPKFEEVTQYHMDEILDKTPRFLKSGETSSDHYSNLWKTILSGQVWRGEFHNRKKNGELYWESAMISPILNEAGVVTHFVAVKQDITEKKKSEELVHLLSHTVESIGECVCITDLQNRLLYINNAFLKTYLYTSEELSGKPISLVRVYTTVSEEEILTATLHGGWKGELLNRKKDGTEFPIALSSSAVFDETGKAVALVGIATDITEQKKLQEQLFQSQKMEAVGRLAGGVAHDYNNMLGVILGYAKMLEKEVRISESAHHKVNAIVSAAERSANLTKQLLSFARKQIVAPVVLNLNEEIIGMQKMLERLVGEDVSLDLRLTEHIWNIKIDPIQVTQILTNLISNARDAITNVGTITIETVNLHMKTYLTTGSQQIPAGEYVHVTFRDTGVGMSSKTMAKIFEPFFTTKPVGQGTGLGLATVFGIVKQNNGHITVSSEVGQGTTFELYFPRCDEQRSLETDEEQQVSLAGTEAILLVEDEQDLIDYIKLALENFGYTVFAATSPLQALRLCKEHHHEIDLLVTDVIMPMMNGKELKEQIQQLYPKIKTLYMSGYTAEIVAHRGVLDEGIQFLQKPFTPTVLARKIRILLDQSEKR